MKKDPIGSIIKATRKARSLSAPELSVLLDIPKDRIYKWEQGVTPKFEDRQKIDEWLRDPKWKKVPHGTEFSASDSIPVSQHINVLNRHNEDLRKDKEILANIIQTNLTMLQKTQQVILAEVKTVLRWDAIKTAKGDRQKEAQILGQINTLVGEYLLATDVESMR